MKTSHLTTAIFLTTLSLFGLHASVADDALDPHPGADAGHQQPAPALDADLIQFLGIAGQHSNISSTLENRIQDLLYKPTDGNKEAMRPYANALPSPKKAGKVQVPTPETDGASLSALIIAAFPQNTEILNQVHSMFVINKTPKDGSKFHKFVWKLYYSFEKPEQKVVRDTLKDAMNAAKNPGHSPKQQSPKNQSSKHKKQ